MPMSHVHYIHVLFLGWLCPMGFKFYGSFSDGRIRMGSCTVHPSAANSGKITAGSNEPL